MMHESFWSVFVVALITVLFIFYLKELPPTEGIGGVETFRLQVVLRSMETTLSSGTDHLEENIL